MCLSEPFKVSFLPPSLSCPCLPRARVRSMVSPILSVAGCWCGPGAGAHLTSALLSSCMIILRVNGETVFTLPVYKVSKAIIMTRNWQEQRENKENLFCSHSNSFNKVSSCVLLRLRKKNSSPKLKHDHHSWFLWICTHGVNCVLDGDKCSFTYWLVF